MKSIGTRLTVWYALSATATLAILFAVGYGLLESRLTHGLDQLIYAYFQQIRAKLGDDVKGLDSRILEERVRETSEYSSTLFYITIESPGTGTQFLSRNLLGHPIPDIKGQREFNAIVDGIGEMRVNEFLLPPLDVSIGTPTRALRESMTAYVKVCTALLLAMLLVSFGIGFGLSRMMLQPIRIISETANRISSDNLSERIPVDDVRDEISALARLLNQMFDRLESAFARIRRFSDEASHELKTPLSLVRLHAEKMLSDGDLSPVHTDAVLVQLEELGRLNRIIDDLLFLSRAEAEAIVFDLQPQDPRQFLDGFNQDAVALIEHYGRRFTYQHEGTGLAIFEEKWVRQVLLNVLSNALNVSPPGGLISLHSKISNGVWRASIEDEGPGLPVDQHKRIFERFVRCHVTDSLDRGSGLGLAICHSIIDLHRGRIFAETGPHGRGLQVTFEIPAAAESSAAV
jgi:two-component system heavy metal sensor histidine kinase CusS